MERSGSAARHAAGSDYCRRCRGPDCCGPAAEVSLAHGADSGPLSRLIIPERFRERHWRGITPSRQVRRATMLTSCGPCPARGQRLSCLHCSPAPRLYSPRIAHSNTQQASAPCALQVMWSRVRHSGPPGAPEYLGETGHARVTGVDVRCPSPLGAERFWHPVMEQWC